MVWWGRWLGGDVGTIEEGTACSTLRMSRVLIWREVETGGNGWQIEQAILLATHNNPYPAREELDENGSCAIQAIQTNQDVRQGHTEPARIADDGLACASQFSPIVPIARSTEGAEPVVGVSLQHRRSGPSHLPSLAPQISRSTDPVKASMGRGKFGNRGQGSLSCRLFGAINIDDEPVLTLTIPQSPWRKGLARSPDQIFEKQCTQRLDRWLIQGSEKTTERGAMGQGLSTEECHKGRCKRGEALIKRQKGGFCTHHISDEHGDKIYHLIGAESWACKTHLSLDGLEQTARREELCYDRYLSKPAGN